MIRLFRVFIPHSVLLLLLSEAVLLYFCLCLASILILDVDPQFFLFYDGGLARFSIVVVSILGGMYFEDLYTNLRIRSRLLLLQQVSISLGVSFLVQALLTYIDPALMTPRWVMFYAGLLTLIILPAYRIAYTAAVLRKLSARRVLLVGNSPVLGEIARRFRETPELGLTAIGYLDEEEGKAPDGVRYLGSIKNLKKTVKEEKPELLVVGLEERRGRLPVYDLLELRLEGTEIEDAGHVYEIAHSRISIRELKPSQLVFTSEIGPPPGSVMLQNAYSMLIALLGTILFLPVMLLVAAAVKLTSTGPVFYRQMRVGRNGKTFELLKFRSMYEDAEARSGAVWAAKDDPRVTPAGRWLRLFRLDELPQFFNILRGEMNLVGPRPERPEFVKSLSEQIPFYQQRHRVKPGITGWAQINHKYGNTIEDTIIKLEYDLYYIKHISPALDMYIVFHTLKTVLLGRGAH